MERLAWFWMSLVGVVAHAQTVQFTVDAQQNVKPISRFIYGVNQALDGAYANLTLTRAGGNRWTAYNWENNASNAGSDWNYQNDGYLGGGSTPGGAVMPTLTNAAAHNAGAILTIPINGYVAADKNGGGDVRASGANYLQTRFKQSLPAKGAAFTLTPSTSDAYVYQDEFVNWIKTNYAYGQTDPNRPIWFSLDNEPDLWSSTHAEVHPAAVTYAELVQKTIAYATAIKTVSPSSKIFGPVSYGWNGYTTLQNAPDAAGRDFLEFYLAQMKQAELSAGKRLLDVLDVHWYPEAQGGGVRITGTETSGTVVAARLQAPRSLWDPTYTETSWITQWSTYGPIKLLPRLQDKIDRNYAGTKLAITEYNYGGGQHISGGIAQADALGIFGREGVLAANEWQLNSDESFIAGAFRMFRNYDGANGTFGDTSILASTANIADTSLYASLDSADPHRLVLVAINKTDHAISGQIQLDHGQAFRWADVYQLTSASADPQYAGRLTLVSPTTLSYTLPAYSVSTLNVTDRRNWSGAGGNSYLATAANWSNGAPAATDPIGFAGGATLKNVVNGGATPLASVGSITFDASGYTLSSTSTLTIHGAITNNAAVTAIDAPLELAAVGGVIDGGPAASNVLTISKPISGSVGLTKTGAGKVVLTQDTSYTGDTMVAAGTLVLAGLSNSDSTTVSGMLVANYLRQDVLTINAGGKVQIDAASGGTSVVNFLRIADGSGGFSWDMGSDDMAVAHVGERNGEPAAPVPEPATWMLVVVGVGLLSVGRRMCHQRPEDR